MEQAPITPIDNQPATAQPEPLVQPPLKKSNRLWLIVAVVTVLILGVGTGTLYVLQQNKDNQTDHSTMTMSPTPTPTTTPTPTPTSDAYAGWQTYTDSKYGFSFKYPSSLKVTHSYDTDMDMISVSNADAAELISFNANVPFGCAGPDNSYANSPSVDIILGSSTKTIAPKCYGYKADVVTSQAKTLALDINFIGKDQEADAKLLLASVNGLTWK